VHHKPRYGGVGTRGHFSTGGYGATSNWPMGELLPDLGHFLTSGYGHAAERAKNGIGGRGFVEPCVPPPLYRGLWCTPESITCQHPTFKMPAWPCTDAAHADDRSNKSAGAASPKQYRPRTTSALRAAVRSCTRQASVSFPTHEESMGPAE
jgi:hypothetical protein